MDRIDQLAAKLRELATKDIVHSVFGASSHGYRLNPCLTVSNVEQIEHEFSIQLPDDYRDFLTRVGNGGPGPYYGLLSLEKAVSGLSSQLLAEPFPLTEEFNPYTEAASNDEVPHDPYVSGTVVLARQGCGYIDFLVVSGPQYGQVWSDFSAANEGFVPLHLDFYSWYEKWLINSLGKFGKSPAQP